MWNKNMILIDNPDYTIIDGHKLNKKFCPMALINRDKYCIMPCFFFDTPYCSYYFYSDNQKKVANKWWKNENEKSKI
jgi:hypothetical protein